MRVEEAVDLRFFTRRGTCVSARVCCGLFGPRRRQLVPVIRATVDRGDLAARRKGLEVATA